MKTPQWLLILSLLILVVNNYGTLRKLFAKKNP